MAKAGVIVPAIIASLIVCAIILLTCAYVSYPQYFIRIGRGGGGSSDSSSDIESASSVSEKVVVIPAAPPPPPAGGPSRVAGLAARFGGGGRPAGGVVNAEPDVQIIEPTPDAVNIVDAQPPRGWFR